MKKCSLVSPLRFTFSLCAAAMLCLAVCLATGCNKEEGNTTSASGSTTTSAAVAPVAPKTSLLDAVPANAVMAGSMDTTSAGYAKWKESPYGALSTKLQNLSMDSLPTGAAPGAPDLKGMTALFNGIRQTGLINFEKGQPSSAKEIVYFMTISPPKTPGTPPNFAMTYYFTAASGTKMKEKLAQLGTFLGTQGFAPQNSSANGLDQFTVQLMPNTDPAAPALPFGTVYAAANDDKLALTSDQSLTARLFAADQSGGLTTTEAYKEAASYLPANLSNLVCYGYFDIKLLAASVAGAAPQEEREKIKSSIGSMPFESVAGYLAVEDHPVMRYVLPLHPKTDSQKKLFTMIQGAKAPGLLKNTPEQALFFLTLDGSALQSAKETALAEADPAQAEAAKAQLALLDQIHGIGLGVANATAASPFPEVFILAESDKSAELAATLKTLAMGLSASSGMPATPWQQKQIEGVNVDYMLSPFGVGLFIGNSGDAVFVASSETMASSIITTSTKKTPALGANLTEFQSGAAVAGYLNFGKLYGLIDTVRGSLGMFTGGQSNIDMNQFTLLKELGSATATVSCDGKSLQVATHLRADAVKQ